MGINADYLLNQLLISKDEINNLAAALFFSKDKVSGKQGLFDNITLVIPRIIPAELGFTRVVSWLYVLYKEAGALDVNYVIDKFDAFGLDVNKHGRFHYGSVRDLRTYLHHNLNLVMNTDRGILVRSQGWFRIRCGCAQPDTDDKWSACLVGILQDANGFMRLIKECIEKIVSDESCEQIVRDWQFRRDRYIPPVEFDALVAKICIDMGREAIDATKIRKRYYDKWIKELQSIRGDSNIDIEVRKIVEMTIINETARVLPLTGKDIMQEFQIPPGPKVGDMLIEASKIYFAGPCSASELLRKLKDTIKGIS